MSGGNPYELPSPLFPPFGRWWQPERTSLAKATSGYYPLWAKVGELSRRWADEPNCAEQRAIAETLSELWEASMAPLPARGGKAADQARFDQYRRGIDHAYRQAQAIPGPRSELTEETLLELRFAEKLSRIAEDGFMKAHYDTRGSIA